MTSDNFIFQRVFDPKDEIDSSILKHSINMIMGLNLDAILAKDKKFEPYFNYIKDVTQSLLKVNGHRRKYISNHEAEIKSLFEKEINNPNQNVDISINPIELNSEIDAFLFHIKAALDTLAKSLGLLFGFNCHGWHKDNKVSGGKIIKSLDNFPKKEKVEKLKKFIEENVRWISYIVYLRDSPSHHGEIKNVSQPVFKHKEKSIQPQYIFHPDNSTELISDFLTRTIKEIDIFIHNIIVLSLNATTWPGMIIIENKNTGDFPVYQWAIIKQKEQKSN